MLTECQVPVLRLKLPFSLSPALERVQVPPPIMAFLTFLPWYIPV